MTVKVYNFEQLKGKELLLFDEIMVDGDRKIIVAVTYDYGGEGL